jgi:hypothetical protein
MGAIHDGGDFYWNQHTRNGTFLHIFRDALFFDFHDYGLLRPDAHVGTRGLHVRVVGAAGICDFFSAHKKIDGRQCSAPCAAKYRRTDAFLAMRISNSNVEPTFCLGRFRVSPPSLSALPVDSESSAINGPGEVTEAGLGTPRRGTESGLVF